MSKDTEKKTRIRELRDSYFHQMYEANEASQPPTALEQLKERLLGEADMMSGQFIHTARWLAEKLTEAANRVEAEEQVRHLATDMSWARGSLSDDIQELYGRAQAVGMAYEMVENLMEKESGA